MERIGEMPTFFLFAFRFVRLLFGGHRAIAIENAALRMQIAALQRKTESPAANGRGSVILGVSSQRGRWKVIEPTKITAEKIKA